MAKELVFDLQLEEIPVKLRDSDGEVRNYTLRELDGKDRDAWISSRARKDKHGNLVLVDGKPVPVIEGAESLLLASSLFDEQGDPIPREEIESWPGRVVEALAEEAISLSRLTETDEGKDQGENEDSGSA